MTIRRGFCSRKRAKDGREHQEPLLFDKLRRNRREKKSERKQKKPSPFGEGGFCSRKRTKDGRGLFQPNLKSKPELSETLS